MEGYNQKNKTFLPGFVYVIHDGYRNFKIGYTTVNPEIRLKQINRTNVLMPKNCQLVFSCHTDTNAFYLENIIHMSLDQFHVKGEWFSLRTRELVLIYQLFQHFGSVAIHDHWFEVVDDEDIKHYNDNGLYFPALPQFTRVEYDEYWKDNLDFVTF